MALIKCPECGNEISDKALKCPKCGYENKKVKKSKAPIFIGVGIGLGILLILLIVTVIVCSIIITKKIKNNTEVSNGNVEIIEEQIIETEELVEDDVVDETQKGGRLNPYKKGETAVFDFYCKEDGTGTEYTGTASFKYTGDKWSKTNEEWETSYHQYLFDTSIENFTGSGQLKYEYAFNSIGVDAAYKAFSRLGVYGEWNRLLDDEVESPRVYNGGSSKVAVSNWDDDNIHYIVITYTKPNHKSQYSSEGNDRYDEYVDEIWFEVE